MANFDVQICFKNDNGEYDNLYPIINTDKLPAPKTIYSTEEQIVGTWIDDKTLYRKTVKIFATVATGKTVNQTIMSMTGINEIISQNGSIHIYNNGTLKNYFPIPVTSDTAALLGKTSCFATVVSGNLLLVCSTDSSTLAGTWTATVTVEYTKTS